MEKTKNPVPFFLFINRFQLFFISLVLFMSFLMLLIKKMKTVFYTPLQEFSQIFNNDYFDGQA